MTVLNVYQIAGGRELNVDIDGIKTASLVYKVITDGVMSLPAIMADPALTVVGETYPDNPDMFVVGTSLRDMSDNVIAYDLTLSYSNQFERTENPLSEPARVSITGEYYQVPVFRDRYGKAVVTSSGEYPEGVFEDAVQINFQVQKNVTAVPSWLLTAAGAVNISPFSIRGIGINTALARLGAVSVSDALTRNGFGFYAVTIPISFRAKGWKTEFMDRGYMEYRTFGFSATKKQVPILMADGQLPSSPVPLDGNGRVLANPTVDNIVILEYDTKFAFDFNGLPLT